LALVGLATPSADWILSTLYPSPEADQDVAAKGRDNRIADGAFQRSIGTGGHHKGCRRCVMVKTKNAQLKK
jgi:hypothetical protein